jgi:hypothetical protein
MNVFLFYSALTLCVILIAVLIRNHRLRKKLKLKTIFIYVDPPYNTFQKETQCYQPKDDLLGSPPQGDESELNESLKTQIIENAHLIQMGVKPCSVIMVKSEYISDALKLPNLPVKACVRQTKDNKWCQLWLYKDYRLLDIILRTKEVPETDIDHFINGCIFGYSIDSILDFIEKNNSND